MGDFGAKEQAEAAGATDKPMQNRQKQSADESEQQAEACSSKPEKRGPKPKLNQDERHKNKIESCRKYREKKATENEALQKKCQRLEKENDELKKKLGFEINSFKEEVSEAENEALQKKCQELEKENEELKKKDEAQQLQINMLQEQLSEMDVRADKLAKELSGESIKVNVVKMVKKVQEIVMQQLQEKLLNQDDQEHDAENSDWDIQMDDEYLNKFFLEGMGGFNELLNSTCSKTKEVPLFGEGCSIAKAISPLRETMNVKGFSVPEENSDMIQEIFRKFPNAASGIQFHHPASRNGFINTLAEVYKMVTRKEMHSPEEINHMQVGIGDLERAGFEISWLEDLVEKRQEEAEDEEIRIMEDKVNRLKERKSERREERKSKRQRAI